MCGLKAFAEQDGDIAERWAEWEHITLCSDQGSDMVSAMHALEYHGPIRCNTTVFWDIEHGVNRNQWAAIDATSLKPLMMLVMLCLNLPNAPDDTDLRYRQVKDMMAEHYEVMTPSTSPIFEFTSADLHKERRLELQCEDGETKDAALWKLLKHRSYYACKGDRVCIARFNAIIAGSMRLLASWYSTAFELCVSALEGGMIQKRVLPKITLQAKGADAGSVGEEGTTSRKVISTVDRTLQCCGANGVVISLAVVSEDLNRRNLSIVATAGSHAMDWAADAARTMKSVQENTNWLGKQLQGGLCDNVLKILNTLCELEYLCDAWFFPALDGHGNDSISEISFENEVAQVVGCFVVHLAAAQARCFMWMFGWPHKFVEALVDPSAAQSVFDEFRKDCQHFDLLCREACRSGFVAKLYMQRHMMQKR